MNHYPRHIGDFVSATIGLSLAERGAYSALLDRYYQDEKPLPLDRKEIYRMSAATTAAERKAVDYVLGRFFSEGKDGWHQQRADREISAYQQRANTARQNGQLGGRPTNQIETQSVISGLAKKTQRKTNHKPVTSNQEDQKQNHTPNPLVGAEAPPGVRQEVWEMWRRAKGKKLTADAYALQCRTLAAAVADGHDPNAMVEASVQNGWSGIFPPKPKTPNTPARSPTLTERRTANLDALCGLTSKDRNEPIDITPRRVDKPAISAPADGIRESEGCGNVRRLADAAG